MIETRVVVVVVVVVVVAVLSDFQAKLEYANKCCRKISDVKFGENVSSHSAVVIYKKRLEPKTWQILENFKYLFVHPLRKHQTKILAI